MLNAKRTAKEALSMQLYAFSVIEQHVTLSLIYLLSRAT